MTYRESLIEEIMEARFENASLILTSGGGTERDESVKQDLQRQMAEYSSKLAGMSVADLEEMVEYNRQRAEYARQVALSSIEPVGKSPDTATVTVAAMVAISPPPRDGKRRMVANCIREVLARARPPSTNNGLRTEVDKMLAERGEGPVSEKTFRRALNYYRAELSGSLEGRRA